MENSCIKSVDNKVLLTSPIITHCSGRTFNSATADKKKVDSGLPTTSACIPAEYSNAVTNPPEITIILLQVSHKIHFCFVQLINVHNRGYLSLV
jgi:hypothetical protein